MNWKKERDLFIAQTLAFVQSVTGKMPETESQIEPAPVSAVQQTEPAFDIQLPRPAPFPSNDLRAEMQNRISNFRAHQERFHREREEYFLTTLAKARTANETLAGRIPQE